MPINRRQALTLAGDRAAIPGLIRTLPDLPLNLAWQAEDFLLHVAVPDTNALYAFVIDRLTERGEVADVNTSVVYEHIRRPVLEPLDDGGSS